MRIDEAWLLALAGGGLIGLASSLLLVCARETAGISGILSGALAPDVAPRERSWRVMFVAGLVLGGLALLVARPASFSPGLRSLPMALLAGALVGLGTRLSGGCTSGHGVCGLSRLSGRSLVATMTFIAAGVMTVWAFGPGAPR